MKTKNFIFSSSFFIFILVNVLFISSGCNKLNSVFTTIDTKPQQAEVKEEPEEERKWNPEDGYIFILFGYGFNTEEFYTDIISQLSKKYGLEEDGGIIIPITYPDGLKGRISNIYDIINSRKVKGIILLGAPDNTHSSLVKLRDNWNKEPSEGDTELLQEVQKPYPIFSFMPQDDILGQESNCDFVLEYERSSNIEEEEEETLEIKLIDKTVEEILVRSIRYMEELTEPLATDDKLHAHVQTIVGENKIYRYTDSVTGIQAINHFVIEKKEIPQEKQEAE